MSPTIFADTKMGRSHDGLSSRGGGGGHLSVNEDDDGCNCPPLLLLTTGAAAAAVITRAVNAIKRGATSAAAAADVFLFAADWLRGSRCSLRGLCSRRRRHCARPLSVRV